MEKPLPTDAELAVLNSLWTRGTATVREVYEDVSAVTECGYTTVLKTMQIMTDKGLVTRDDSERTHRYRAAVKEEATQKRLLNRLVDKAFAGSTAKLVMRALAASPTSSEELDAVRKLIDQLDTARREGK